MAVPILGVGSVAGAVDLPLGATQSGETQSLVVCAWQLPDMDLDATTGMQYRNPDGLADDNRAAFPSPAQNCASATPLQTDTEGTIQVIANPADARGARAVELWSAVTLPGGRIDAVEAYWDVFYPDGSFKTRVIGSPLEQQQCAELGAVADEGSMFSAAVATAQLDVAASEALAISCAGGATGLFTGSISLSHREPCGAYTVENRTVSAEGLSLLTTTIEVGCFQYLSFDVASVDWGSINAGQSKGIRGDANPETASAPTVVNTGSGGGQVGIRFTEMVPHDPATGQAIPGGVAINDFGATVTVTTTGAPHTITQAPLDTVAWFDGPSATLCAGESARLDLTLRAPDVLSAGRYTGSIQVFTRPANSDGVESVCNNDKGVYGGGWVDEAGNVVTNQRNSAVQTRAPEAPAAPEVLALEIEAPDGSGGGDAGDPAPSTTTTTSAGGSSTTTTTKAPGGSTTTTTKAPGGSTTTTTQPPGGSTTTTTAPTSTTTTTTAPGGSTTTTTAPASTTTTTTTTTTTLPPADPPPDDGGLGTDPDPDAEPELPLPHILIVNLLDDDGNLLGFEFQVVVGYDEFDEPILDEEFDMTTCMPFLDVDLDEDTFNDGDLNLDGIMDLDEAWIFECGYIPPDPPPAP